MNFKKYYDMLGNTKGQKFYRFLLLFITFAVSIMLIVNVGCDETKGGLYWKPADVSFHKTINKNEKDE